MVHSCLMANAFSTIVTVCLLETAIPTIIDTGISVEVVITLSIRQKCEIKGN